MKKLFIVCLAFVFVMTLGFANVYAQMPSGKGSAAISDSKLIAETEETQSWDEILSTYIKVPQDKELTFDVSLECGLYTETLVKSKGGIKDTSEAEAKVQVRVMLQKFFGLDENDQPILGEPIYAFPGGTDPDYGVTFCKRRQNLMAKFQGIFQECLETGTDPVTGKETCIEWSNSCLTVTGIDDDGDGIHDRYITSLDWDCLAYEEVQLILDTVSANAFNFIRANVDQGEYKVTVEAEVTSNTDFQNGGAIAWGLVGMGSMVVDEVRFIKDDVGQNK